MCSPGLRHYRISQGELNQGLPFRDLGWCHTLETESEISERLRFGELQIVRRKSTCGGFAPACRLGRAVIAVGRGVEDADKRAILMREWGNNGFVKRTCRNENVLILRGGESRDAMYHVQNSRDFEISTNTTLKFSYCASWTNHFEYVRRLRLPMLYAPRSRFSKMGFFLQLPALLFGQDLVDEKG